MTTKAELIKRDGRYDAVVIREGTNLLEVAYQIDNSKKPLMIGQETFRILTHVDDPLARWTSRPLEYVSAQSISKAEKIIRHMVQARRNLIRNAKNHPAYQKMLEIVKTNVAHFSSDFYAHDCQMIGESSTRRFIWLVRSTGTWMIDRKGDFNYHIVIYDRKENESVCRFWYDGEKLVQIEKEEVEKYYDLL